MNTPKKIYLGTHTNTGKFLSYFDGSIEYIRADIAEQMVKDAREQCEKLIEDGEFYRNMIIKG